VCGWASKRGKGHWCAGARSAVPPLCAGCLPFPALGRRAWVSVPTNADAGLVLGGGEDLPAAHVHRPAAPGRPHSSPPAPPAAARTGSHPGAGSGPGTSAEYHQPRGVSGAGEEAAPAGSCPRVHACTHARSSTLQGGPHCAPLTAIGSMCMPAHAHASSLHCWCARAHAALTCCRPNVLRAGPLPPACGAFVRACVRACVRVLAALCLQQAPPCSSRAFNAADSDWGQCRGRASTLPCSSRLPTACSASPQSTHHHHPPAPLRSLPRSLTAVHLPHQLSARPVPRLPLQGRGHEEPGARSWKGSAAACLFANAFCTEQLALPSCIAAQECCTGSARPVLLSLEKASSPSHLCAPVRVRNCLPALQDSMNIKMLLPQCEESRRLIDWVEDGGCCCRSPAMSLASSQSFGNMQAVVVQAELRVSSQLAPVLQIALWPAALAAQRPLHRGTFPVHLRVCTHARRVRRHPQRLPQDPVLRHRHRPVRQQLVGGVVAGRACVVWCWLPPA